MQARLLQKPRVQQHPCRGRAAAGWDWGCGGPAPFVGVQSPGCSSPLLSSILQSWKWVLAPVLLYVFERILRVWRARQKVVVTKVGGAGAREGGDGAAALAGVAAGR